MKSVWAKIGRSSKHAFIPVKDVFIFYFLCNELKKRVRILEENLEEYVFAC